MGFLHYFGLDDLADSVNEFTESFDELKTEIISSIVDPGVELKETVNDIADSVANKES